MAKELTYKKATTVTLKACGIVDIDNGTIEIEGENKKILDLLKDFDGCYTELQAKISDSEELPLKEGTE